jgi:excisionase family DNA binding protein
MVKERAVTIPQLAKMLGLSRIAVYKKVKAGQIPATKVGRFYVISDRTVNEVLNKSLRARDKQRVDRAVKKVVRDYGDVLKRLARE